MITGDVLRTHCVMLKCKHEIGNHNNSKETTIRLVSVFVPMISSCLRNKGVVVEHRCVATSPAHQLTSYVRDIFLKIKRHAIAARAASDRSKHLERVTGV